MKLKKSYPLGKTLKRMVKNIAVMDKSIFFLFGLYTILKSVYPFFAILLPKVMIEELMKGQQADMYRIIYIAVGFFIIAGIVGYGRVYVELYTYPKLSILRMNYTKDIFVKLVTMDYKNTEDASFYKRNGKVLDAMSANNNDIEGVYHLPFELPALLITVLALMIFIGRLNVLVLLGLCINAAAIIWIKYSVSRYQYSRKEDLSHVERKKKYYYTTTHDFGFGKDIRLYNFKERIIANYHKQIEGYVGIYKQIYNKEYLLGFISLLTLIISDAITYGILIYKTSKGMPIADFSMYLSAAVSLSLVIKQASEKVSSIIQEGQYVWDYYCFMDSDLGEKGGVIRQ